MAAITIPVVQSIINTATMSTARSNVQTLDSQLKLTITDVDTENEETYGASASNRTLTVGDVIKHNAIPEACETRTYKGRDIVPVWNKAKDTVELMYVDDNTNVENGSTISASDCVSISSSSTTRISDLT